MDKNAGAGILMCKRHHYNITKATFYDDTDHYKHTHKNKSEIMEDFQKFHEKNGEKIHRFHGKKRSIPYAYTLLKFKDINRTRPIVSYFKHPLKETYNFASRALAHVIRMAQTDNFTLWKCQDMKQRIQKAQQDLTSQFNNTTKIMPLILKTCTRNYHTKKFLSPSNLCYADANKKREGSMSHSKGKREEEYI